MPPDAISRKTRTEFREFLVGTTLREIDDYFEAGGVICREDFDPPLGGARRRRVEQYYYSLNFAKPTDIEAVLRVFEYILNDAFRPRSDGQHVPSTAAKNLVYWLEKDGFRYDPSSGKLTSTSRVAHVADLRIVALEWNAANLAEDVLRLERAVETDPALAIGLAKELVESCCKTILTERQKTGLDELDVAQLVKATALELNLVPDAVPEGARGAGSIRRILANLASVTQGLAEIRNLYGTGHGREGRHRGLGARHARLAVGASTTLVRFLFETHQERSKK